MNAKWLSLVLAAAITIPAAAAPASWYRWRSNLTGKTFCAQVMQGEWEKVAGPFKDAQCQKPKT